VRVRGTKLLNVLKTRITVAQLTVNLNLNLNIIIPL
jgi:hypothetical protein